MLFIFLIALWGEPAAKRLKLFFHHILHDREGMVSCAMARVKLCFWVFIFQLLCYGPKLFIRLIAVQQVESANDLFDRKRTGLKDIL